MFQIIKWLKPVYLVTEFWYIPQYFYAFVLQFYSHLVTAGNIYTKAIGNIRRLVKIKHTSFKFFIGELRRTSFYFFSSSARRKMFNCLAQSTGYLQSFIIIFKIYLAGTIFVSSPLFNGLDTKQIAIWYYVDPYNTQPQLSVECNCLA